MYVIQEVFIPHNLQHRFKFLVGIPELKDNRQEIKKWETVSHISNGFFLPAQPFAYFRELSGPVLESFRRVPKERVPNGGEMDRPFQLIDGNKLSGEVAIILRIA